MTYRLADLLIWPALAGISARLLLSILPCDDPAFPVPAGSPAPGPAFVKPPVLAHFFHFRGGTGAFNANRPGDVGADFRLHDGVDLTQIASTNARGTYVFASGNGRIAYAQLNQKTETNGYGWTVIIDHGEGEYTLYAHMAPVASKRCVAVGDHVFAGQIIGWVSIPAEGGNPGEASSGNARAGTGVAPWDKSMVHIEYIRAPTGWPGGTVTSLKASGSLQDPTASLKKFGY